VKVKTTYVPDTPRAVLTADKEYLVRINPFLGEYIEDDSGRCIFIGLGDAGCYFLDYYLWEVIYE
jgi:hypothetical protein